MSEEVYCFVSHRHLPAAFVLLNGAEGGFGDKDSVWLRGNKGFLTTHLYVWPHNDLHAMQVAQAFKHF
jgi:hypothetical protein